LHITIRKAIDQTVDSTIGGLSAKGTKEDPIQIVVTYDGANLTEDDTGVRLALVVRAALNSFAVHMHMSCTTFNCSNQPLYVLPSTTHALTLCMIHNGIHFSQGQSLV